MLEPIESLIDMIGDYIALVFGEKAKKPRILTVISVIIIILFILLVIYKF